MINSHNALLSEIEELEDILTQIPLGDVIERSSFESRLATARSALEALPPLAEKEKARLTFRGRPVLGSRGIAADFASKATGAFADAFAAVTAGLNESLRYMGPIPDRAKNQLLITGTAVGSFGFEFELPPVPQNLFPEGDKAAEALDKIQDLFRASANGTDDEVAELVEVIHPRAVKKISEFLSYLVQQQAWCGLEFKDRFFRFEDSEQLLISAERLQESNLRESHDRFLGEFQGVLPSSRTFEFKLLDGSTVIKGKVDLAITDPDVLNRDWLHKPVSVKLHVFQVGQGRPRYAMLDIADIQPRTN